MTIDQDIALYLRQSLDKEGEMVAIGRQRSDSFASVITPRGWDDRVREYVDNDKSASRGHRPAYTQMLDDIADGKIRAVVAWDLDRLYRQPRELEDLIDLADKNGLLLATATGDTDLATDNGRMYARVKGAFARGEVERKAARQRLANRSRAEAGIPSGTRRMFGYTEDYQLHPIEAEIARSMLTRFLSGVKLRAIAAELNAMGVTTTEGGPWQGPVVGGYLRNPRLAGLSHYRGEILGKGRWPGIVDEDSWRSAQAILAASDRNVRPGVRARKYLMTGIALCGAKCEAKRKVTSVMSVKRVPAYTCPVCRGVRRDQISLDEHITDLIAMRLSRPDARDLLVDQAAPDLPALHAESARLQGRLDALALEFAEDAITPSQLRTATERLRGKLAAVEREMNSGARMRILDGLILGSPGEVSDALARSTLARRRELVSMLFERVVVLPTGRRGRGFSPEYIGIDWSEC